MRPGITGWAQAHARNALTGTTSLTWTCGTSTNRSVGLDVRNIAATVRNVVWRDGISHEGHVTRPEFPGPGIDWAEAAP